MLPSKDNRQVLRCQSRERAASDDGFAGIIDDTGVGARASELITIQPRKWVAASDSVCRVGSSERRRTRVPCTRKGIVTWAAHGNGNSTLSRGPLSTSDHLLLCTPSSKSLGRRGRHLKCSVGPWQEIAEGQLARVGLTDGVGLGSLALVDEIVAASR